MMHIIPSSSTKAIYAEFGRFPLIIKQNCQLIKYLKRILTMNENSIVKRHIILFLNYMSLDM